MNLKLYKDESLRVIADYKENNFINITGVGHESMAVDMYSHFQYIEIRKKKDLLRVFVFPKKSLKKECDFGWWEDAQVVFSQNEQIMNK